MPQGFAQAYSKGTQSVLGYSEHSQGVLGALTGGTPSTHPPRLAGRLRVRRRSHHLPRDARAAARRAELQAKVGEYSEHPGEYSEYPVSTHSTLGSTHSTPCVCRRPAVPSCMGNVPPKANTQPQESVQQVRAGGCGYTNINRYIDVNMYYTHTHANPPAGNEWSPERFLRINRTRNPQP